MPVEMPAELLADVQRARPPEMETEVFGYGRLPLAFSARCFTARRHDRPKDDCGFSCLDDPDGLTLATRDEDPFLVLNGIEVQSARCQSLIAEIAALRALGVEVMRISPQSRDTARVLELFHACRTGTIDTTAAARELAQLAPGAPCDGYWRGLPGMARTGLRT